MAKIKTKICQNCKSKFVIEPEDFEFYKKVDVPEPTWCPECRMQRRFAFRNERMIYKRKCDFSNKMVFSEFSPEAPIKVYELKIWNSDKWNSMDYGRDYDFSKPFFGQFKELIQKVPWPSRSIDNAVNSDYSMNGGYLKNCYYTFNTGFSEDCAYGVDMAYSKDCYDNLSIARCEICYDNFMLAGCYKAFYSYNCADCQEIYFCKNCVNCQNCFGCVNLRHKKYHIFNKLYSKEEYFKKLGSFNLGSYQDILSLDKKAKESWLKHPVKFIHGRKNVNVTGEDIYNSKNVFDSYSIKNGEDLKCCQIGTLGPIKDCYDCSVFGHNTSLAYESLCCFTGVNRLKFCIKCRPDSRNLEYCVECYSSSNLFGCMGLRHKKHCIFNKQYTKKEYEELVPKIKKQMDDMPYKDKQDRVYKYGEFFPIELSPHPYNSSMVQEHFPLTKEQVLKQGYRWYDKPKPEYKATIKPARNASHSDAGGAKNLPDNIRDIDKSILKEVIECENESKGKCPSSGVFRLIPVELEFYQKNNIPLPRLCFECRHQERIKQKNPMKLWKRQCMKKGCQTMFQTTYAPERKEIVYYNLSTS